MWITWGIIFSLIIFTFVHTNHTFFKCMSIIFEKDKLKSNLVLFFGGLLNFIFVQVLL